MLRSARRLFRLLLVATVVMSSAAAVVAVGPTAQAAPSVVVQNGRIMIGAPTGTGGSSLLSVDDAGHGSSLVTGSSPSGDFSDDGSYIVVSVDGSIRAADADGRSPSVVLATGTRPRFSPNISKILYWSGVSGASGDIWTMDNNGTGKVKVATGASYYATGNLHAADPEWSPDGTKILFESGGQVRVVNADGTGGTALATGTAANWRPDGTKVAYSSGGAVRTVNANGTGDAAVSGASGIDPKWSPDGASIMFQKSDGIYTIPAAGGTATRIALGVGDSKYIWSPDGAEIAFTRWNAGNSPASYDLLVAPSTGDGSLERRIVQGSLHRIDDWQPIRATPSKFVGISPKRFLDTRESGQGGALAGGTFLTLQIAGRAAPLNQVPSSATSVVLNVTAVAPSAATYLTVWPTGQPLPLASNLNNTAGDTSPNLVTVKLGKNGSVNVFNAAGSVDVLVDVVGYYTAAAGAAGFQAVAPNRLLDTRSATGGHPARFGPGESFDLVVAGGTTTVPANATSVVVNVTAVAPDSGTFLTVWPKGDSRPTDVSNLNPHPFENRPNLVAVKVGTSQSISIYNALGHLDVVVDVVGYFTTADAQARLFVPTNPYRLYDSRELSLSLGNEGTVSIDSDGQGPIQPGSKALVMNTTITQPTASGFLTVFPSGPVRPEASNLNFAPTQTVPNLVYTGLSSDGKFTAYSGLALPQGSTHVIFDIAGYFIAP